MSEFDQLITNLNAMLSGQQTLKVGMDAWDYVALFFIFFFAFLLAGLGVAALTG